MLEARDSASCSHMILSRARSAHLAPVFVPHTGQDRAAAPPTYKLRQGEGRGVRNEHRQRQEEAVSSPNPGRTAGELPWTHRASVRNRATDKDGDKREEHGRRFPFPPVQRCHRK